MRPLLGSEAPVESSDVELASDVELVPSKMIDINCSGHDVIRERLNDRPALNLPLNSKATCVDSCKVILLLKLCCYADFSSCDVVHVYL